MEVEVEVVVVVVGVVAFMMTIGMRIGQKLSRNGLNYNGPKERGGGRGEETWLIPSVSYRLGWWWALRGGY